MGPMVCPVCSALRYCEESLGRRPEDACGGHHVYHRIELPLDWSPAQVQAREQRPKM